MTNSNSIKKTKTKKIIGIVLDILTYLFFAVCIFALILSVKAKKNYDGAVSLFGKEMRIVLSDSMAKCKETDVSGYEIKDIPVKSAVFIELVPEDEEEADKWYRSLKKGDVLTFRYLYVTQETITHRIIDITEKETGGYIIELEGDNKASDSNTMTQTIDTSLKDSPNFVLGKVTGQNYALGVFVTALKSPVGIVCIVILPSIIIAILEIIRLIGAVTGIKVRGKRSDSQVTDEEYEEMKRRLELFQKMHPEVKLDEEQKPTTKEQNSPTTEEQSPKTEEDNSAEVEAEEKTEGENN